MDERTDMQLLGEWIDRRDRAAVGELVRRHIDFVLNAARRQVNNDIHLAEDITQAVFILFLQKAHQIKSEAAMAGWLFNTTRYAASNARRMIRRREQNERRAAELTVEQDDSRSNENLEPLLNEAIGRLPRTDRECVVMSYLQQKTHRQVAQAMGLSEDAARMRVSRAIRRMRNFFVTRGVTNVSEATVGALLLAGKSSTASAGLIESTLNIATLSQSAASSTSAVTIAKGVSKMFFAMKVKAAAAIAVVIFGSAVTAQVVEHALSHEAAVVVTSQVQASPPVAADPARIDLGDGVIVSFRGISRLPETGSSWQTLDGKPVRRPELTGPPVINPHEAKFIIDASIECPNSTAVGLAVQNVTIYSFRRSDNGGQHVFEIAFTPKDGATTIEIRASLAEGPWVTTAKLERSGQEPWQRMESVNTPLGSAIVSQAIDRDGNASFFISADRIEGDARVTANDINGLPHMATQRGGQESDKFVMVEYSFDIPALMIRSLELQTRAVTKTVIARNVSLDPAQPTKPEIVVETGKKAQ